jgi:hypothetical protein
MTAKQNDQHESADDSSIAENLKHPYARSFFFAVSVNGFV